MLTRAAMIKRHTPFARLVARRQARGRGITCREAIADLEQASLLGLDKAAQMWDPAKGAFLTIAGIQCRAAVQAEIQRLKGKGSRLMPTFVELTDHDRRDPFAELEDAEHESFVRTQRLADIGYVLDSLPPRDANDFRKHFLEGVPMSTLAKDAGCSRQAVQQRLARVLARVEQELRA